MYGELIDELIEALRCLPGVGPKSAQRMAFYLLERNKRGGLILAEALSEAINKVGHCSQCRTLTELKVCSICSDSRRHADQLCIVETPADMFAIEQSGSYQGLYFVLMGHLSPIDGIGPEEIGIDLLEQRIQEQDIKEIILATNLTVEGEATAYYLSELAKGYSTPVSRIAQGVPQGSDLDSIDGGTLGHAFNSRKPL